MASLVGSILRAATRQDGQPLNILTSPTHESYESGLAKTGHNFFAFRANGIKDWNRAYRPVPENYTLLDPALGEKQLPLDVDFDLVLSQNHAGQFQLLSQIARQLHLPLVSLTHTLPYPSWDDGQLAAIKAMRGDINVFISEFSRRAWGWEDNEAEVVHHGIDTEVFSPNKWVDKKQHLLSVVNDWKNRDWCCGYKLWQNSTKDLPVVVVGATPGLSEPAKSVHDLVLSYREAQVFVNTSLISPIPTALMESMACGCAVISTNTCMVPDVVSHGVNGMLAASAEELRSHCRTLLGDPELCKRLGDEARKTIVERFSQEKFVAGWNEIFQKAAAKVFTG